MGHPFEAVTDNSGRILSYIPEGYPDVKVSPKDIAGSIDGGERVVLDGVEYDLTETGGLVHPDVEVINSVVLGFGVRLDAGTTFHRFKDDLMDPRDRIEIGNNSRIVGTEIADQVTIGSHALIHAQSIGAVTKIGDYARIGQGTTVGHGVKIGPTVKIDRDAQVSHHVTIDYAARIGYKAILGEVAEIGHHAKVGRFTGEGPRGANQDGAFIPERSVVEPKAHVE